MVRKCSYTLESEMTGEEVNEILRCIGKYKPNGIHIEIGTAAGGTMCSILKYYKFVLNFNQPTFIAVDPLSYFETHARLVLSSQATKTFTCISPNGRLNCFKPLIANGAGDHSFLAERISL